MMSRFMANRPISVSMAKPPTVSPPPIFWKSQTTSSSGKGICCFASNLTMSGDLLLLDRRQLDEPHQPALAGDTDGDLVLANRVAVEEFLQRLAGQFVQGRRPVARGFRVFDVVEVVAVGTPSIIRGGRLSRALANVDAPDADRIGHDGVLAYVSTGRGRSPSSAGRDTYSTPPTCPGGRTGLVLATVTRRESGCQLSLRTGRRDCARPPGNPDGRPTAAHPRSPLLF